MISIPKIIRNAKESLTEEAKRQVEELGYSRATVRSIAKACGVSLGTVYNYFPSKDDLIAAFVLEDWLSCLDDMREKLKSASSPRDALFCVYGGIKEFISGHDYLFTDSDAYTAYSSAKGEKHIMLRRQISLLIASPLGMKDGFVSDFVSESILTWVREDVPFDTFYSVLNKII